MATFLSGLGLKVTMQVPVQWHPAGGFSSQVRSSFVLVQSPSCTVHSPESVLLSHESASSRCYLNPVNLCAGLNMRVSTLATISDDVRSGTTATSAASAATNLTQLSNLTDISQLDPLNLTEQYGLHIYGSGSTTGLVVDSGGSEVRSQPAKWASHVPSTLTKADRCTCISCKAFFWECCSVMLFLLSYLHVVPCHAAQKRSLQSYLLLAVSDHTQTWRWQQQQRCTPGQPRLRPAIAANVWGTPHPLCEYQPYCCIWCQWLQQCQPDHHHSRWVVGDFCSRHHQYASTGAGYCWQLISEQ